MGENSAERSRNLRYGIICAVIGLLVGVPVSYFFQSGLPDALQGLGGYISNFKVVFSDKQAFSGDHYAITALLTIAILGVSGFLAGLFVAGIVSGLKEARPNPAAKSPRR